MDVQLRAKPRRRLNEWQVEELISAALAGERQRLASELHDSIGGTLAGVAMGLAALQASTPDAGSREKLAKLADAVGRGQAEIRTLSFALQLPWCEPGATFEGSFAQFAKGFGLRAGLDVSVNVPPRGGWLDAGQALTLMRVLQEALLNVHRHAQARSVRVCLTCDGGSAELVVEDDGVGMPLVEGAPPGGAGLVSMRDRMRRAGGELFLESGPAGAIVSAIIPLRTAKDTVTLVRSGEPS